MRATEFENKAAELKAIMDLNRDKHVSMDIWCTLIEQQSLAGKRFLKESIDTDNLSTIQSAEKAFSVVPIIGNSYIPVPIFLIGDAVQVYDVQGNCPAVRTAEFLPITAITNTSVTIGGIEWPDKRLTSISYMTLILAKNADTYSKICNWLQLTMDVTLPRMRMAESSSESYQPPTLHAGDKILKGKFKNSPAEIKGFKKDKHNQPVLKTNKGDVQLFKPRVVKLMKEEINSDILHPNFSDEQEIGDYRYTARRQLTGYSRAPLLVIKCFDGERRIGEVQFYSDMTDSLISMLTTVSPAYQKQGIASTMYAYARMLGNTIEPSKTQLRPGRKMWAAWKKSGDAKHLMKDSNGK